MEPDPIRAVRPRGREAAPQDERWRIHSATAEAARGARTPSAPLALLTLAVAAFSVGSSLYAAWDQGWTYDEPYHIGWAKRLLEEGTSERRSTPNFNSKTPVMLPNVVFKNAGQALGIQDATALRFLSRLPNVGWFVATLAAVYLLGRRIASDLAAHLAIATALDPNWIAHSSLATTDAPYGLATLLTLGASLGFIRRPTWGRAALLGLALGFAFSTKFTAFLLVPGLLLLPLAVEDPRALDLRPALLRLTAVFVVAWVFVCGAYLFTEVAAPLSSARWRTSFMKDLAARHAGLRLPFPVDFLTGVDMCVAHERGRGWPVMLFGRRHPDGVWYYFLVLWLLKTPVLLLAAQVYGLFRAARARLLLAHPGLRYLALNVLLSGFYFSWLFRAQIGYRYVLMCLPIAYLLAASGLASLPQRRLLRGAVVVVFAAAAESLMYLGNPLAFTSAAVWPKRDVFRLINDSNLGWGQNRMKILAWLAEENMAGSHLDPVHILPGHNTFDVNIVSGLVGFERHRWLRENASPGGHLGHTHVWYRISPALYERFMNEARRYPPLRVQGLCGESASFEKLATGAPAPLAVEDRDAGWIVCVRTGSVVDLGLRVTDAATAFGRTDVPRSDWETIERDQIAWHRLEPGVHAFGAAGARPLRAHWELSGGAVTGIVRPGTIDEQGFIHPTANLPAP